MRQIPGKLLAVLDNVTCQGWKTAFYYITAQKQLIMFMFQWEFHIRSIKWLIFHINKTGTEDYVRFTYIRDEGIFILQMNVLFIFINFN